MKFLILSVSFLFSLSAIAQFKEVIADQYSHFELKHKKDTIHFIVADTSLSEEKPVLIYCQGSQPIPLFVDFGEQGIVELPLSNFNIKEMKKNYHLVAISMPKTPVVVGPDHLNRSYCYVQDTSIAHSYNPEYQKADFLENYVDRANKVIKYLRKQKWVDKSKIVVAGHSQGSRVAVQVAHSNKHVKKLGLFGFSPKRRIDQMVWTVRKQAQSGEITWEQADSLQRTQYEFYRDAVDPNANEERLSLKTWRSFSNNSISKLTGLKIPIYIAFGSEDVIAEYCDLLPLDFAEAYKTDYILKRYPGLEHNFFPVDEEGRPDYQKGQWNNVMMTFIEWSLE